MSRGDYHGLNVLLTGACLKRDKAVVPPIKRCSMDPEHIICFHVWTENFSSFFAPKVAFSNKFIQHSVDEAYDDHCTSDLMNNKVQGLQQ